MDIIKVIEQRYSTKAFTENRKIDRNVMEGVMKLLRLAPSSTNIQPWHFIIAESKAARKRIAKATQGFYIFNETKVLEASAVVIFATRVAAEDEYMNHLIEREDQDGRFMTAEQKAQTHGGRMIFSNIHHYDLKDQQHWLEKQSYLNLGSFLLGVAALGLDALPMEGFDMKILNEEFGLIAKGFTATALVAIGYHSEGDFNLTTPKSRLLMEEVVELI